MEDRMQLEMKQFSLRQTLTEFSIKMFFDSFRCIFPPHFLPRRFSSNLETFSRLPNSSIWEGDVAVI